MDVVTIVTILKYVVAGVAVGLCVVVLLQNRSGGLGTVFGGVSGGEAYRSKRGIEKLMYNLTIILMTTLAASALLIAILSV